MKKSPYEIETFRSVADFPRITKKYAEDALEIINRKISRLKVEKIGYKNAPEFVKNTEREIQKFEGFKSFVEKKLKEFLDSEFQKLTGSKKSETKVEEPKTVETITETEEPEQKEKKYRRGRKKSEKSEDK